MVKYMTSIGLCVILLQVSGLAWVSATQYTVGDSAGWTTGYDYSTWTSGKTFVPGDKLIFTYAGGAHSVTEVGESDYSACSSSNAISTDSTGQTTVALTKPGSHYFICGVPGHCTAGMKVAVTVAASSSTTSPATPASGGGSTIPGTTTTTPPYTTTDGSSSGAGSLPAPVYLVVSGIAGLMAAKMRLPLN